MSHPADFNADEWNTIFQAPAFAVIFIIQAGRYNPSVAYLKMLAGLTAITHSAQPDAPSALVDEVRAAVRAGQRPEYSEEIPFDLDEARQVTLGLCRRAAALLAQRVPSTEADAYISWLLAIAESVAAVVVHHPPEASDTADAERTRAALATLTATLRGV